MKNKTLSLAVLVIASAAFVLGCDQDKRSSQKRHNLEDKTAESVREMKDYAFTQKAEFVRNMEDDLATFNRELDQLSDRIEKSSDSVKAEARPKIAALRDQVGVLNKQLDVARESTESTWGNVKSDFRKSYAASKEGFQQSRQWLSDKIAP